MEIRNQMVMAVKIKIIRLFSILFIILKKEHFFYNLIWKLFFSLDEQTEKNLFFRQCYFEQSKTNSFSLNNYSFKQSRNRKSIKVKKNSLLCSTHFMCRSKIRCVCVGSRKLRPFNLKYNFFRSAASCSRPERSWCGRP